jgi:hypothetical protein
MEVSPQLHTPSTLRMGKGLGGPQSRSYFKISIYGRPHKEAQFVYERDD